MDISYTCPICKEGRVMQEKKNKAICNRCEAIFGYSKSRDGYNLKKKPKIREMKKAYSALETKYPNPVYFLKPHEWERISQGGMSDNELEQYNKEQTILKEQKEETELLEKTANGDLSGITPITDTAILLKKDEIVHIQIEGIKYAEEKTKRQFAGGTAGISFRVAKGVSFRVGGFKGESVPVTELKIIDKGVFVITNKRIVFNGESKNVSFSITKVVNIKEFEDGISISRENKQKNELYLGNFDSPLKHCSIWMLIKAVIQGAYKAATE